ncbi:hypothetical protein ACQY0O_000424 [Thecaphora frezii]
MKSTVLVPFLLASLGALVGCHATEHMASVLVANTDEIADRIAVQWDSPKSGSGPGVVMLCYSNDDHSLWRFQTKQGTLINFRCTTTGCTSVDQKLCTSKNPCLLSPVNEQGCTNGSMAEEEVEPFIKLLTKGDRQFGIGIAGVGTSMRKFTYHKLKGRAL